MDKVERCVKLALFFRDNPRGYVRASELARKFGVNIRSIERDLITLSRSGILPLIYCSGKWSLLEWP